MLPDKKSMRVLLSKYRLPALLSLMLIAGSILSPSSPASDAINRVSTRLPPSPTPYSPLPITDGQSVQVGKPAHTAALPNPQRGPRVPHSPLPLIPRGGPEFPTPLLAQYAGKSATDFLNEGLQAISSGRVQDGIVDFRKAIELDPGLAPAHYNLGLALRQVGQLQPAANAFYRATQADPQFALAFANLGGALLEGNNLSQANDYLQRALELDPKLGVAYYNLGLLRVQQRNWERAIAAFKKAMEYSQNAPEPAYHLGICYIQEGKIDKAKDAFNKAVKINPKYPEAYYNLGTISFNQGNVQDALAAFRKSAEANSNYPNAYYGAGLAFIQLRDFPEAVQVLQFARDLYNAQGNPEWARNAENLLQQLPKQNDQPR